MDREALVGQLQKSASESLRRAYPIPDSVLAIRIAWSFQPDPNVGGTDEGIRLLWRTYFSVQPSEGDFEFVDAAPEILISDLWQNLIWIEHENLVVTSAPQGATGPSEMTLYLKRESSCNA